MQAIRKINNNVVVCIDSSGKELIAMGKGIGFEKTPREISLSDIERTFYELDESHIAVMQDLSADVINFCAKFMDIARNELTYNLSPNVTLALADHIAFAIERCKKNIRVQMPLAYDIAQMYPKEYKLAQAAVKRLSHEYLIYVPETEAAGIAMVLINAKLQKTPHIAYESFDSITEEITEVIEEQLKIYIERDTFNYSRFATHLQYLFSRLDSNTEIVSDNREMSKQLATEYPKISRCVGRISLIIERKWNKKLSDEEKLYLLLHVNRICVKEGL